MLNELVKRLSASGKERRSAERFRKKYQMAWLKGQTLVPALGLEISEKGLLFAAKEVPDGPHADVALDLGGKRVRARVSVVRKGTMPRDGAEWGVVAAVFEGIAADDWDAVVRFCKDVDEVENKAAGELATLAGSPDDAYRLLPLKVQERVVRSLVAARRLSPDSEAKSPLLRMQYVGNTRGKHRLAVHSRWNLDGEMLMFDSFLTIDDEGNVTVER